MQTIYLDISNKGVIPTIYAKQGDVGRKFQVVLTDSGLPYIPVGGSAFSVWYSGASGDGNYTEIGDKSAFSVNGNKVTVEMIAQMLSNDGDGVLSLVLNDPNGNQISTWNIPYICESVPGADSEEAKDYYTAFSKAVENLPYPDTSLSVAGKAADAAAVGVALSGKAPALDWSHLKWYVMGDSLTARDNAFTDKRYYEFVQEKTGIQVIVDGIGGTGYGAGASNSESYYDRVQNIPDDVDIVTIFGSGNDIRYAESANMEIYNTLSWMALNKPGLRVIVVPPSPWKDYNKREDPWKAYCDRLQVCALTCNFRYVSDMYDCPPFNPNFTGHMELFFTTDPEGIHPDENGHKALAPYFYNALLEELALDSDVETPGGGGSGQNPDLTGVVKSVNGVAPDENGNVQIETGGASDEQVKDAVNAYLDEHPVDVSGVVKSVNGQTPDENGNVEFELPESGGIEVTGASVGQTIVVKAVDDNGKPTEWETADLPQGGGSGGGTADINIKKWFGKKIVVDGSSITTGGAGLTQPTWFSFIKDMFALDTVYNHAGSGTCWVGSYNENNAYNRVDEYETDADAVIMMGDYNNSHYEWGNPTDVPDINGSYYARLKALAEKLIAKYPLCPVVWVIEPPRGSDTTPIAALDTTSGVYNISKAIREVAEAYGFPVCDCLHNTVFRPWNITNYEATTSDGVHPWNNVQRTMAQIIAETMKRTPLFYNESYVVTPDTDSGGDNSGSDTSKTVTALKVTVNGEIFESDSLDTVRECLTVKAVYSDLSEAKVTGYEITGTLTAGTSTLTITYGGVSTTVAIEVTEGQRTVTVILKDIDHTAGYILLENSEYAMEGWAYSDYIEVTPATTITLAYVNSGWSSMVCYYDEDKNYIGKIKGTYGTLAYTLPDTAHFVRVNGLVDESHVNANQPLQTITYVPA